MASSLQLCVWQDDWNESGPAILKKWTEDSSASHGNVLAEADEADDHEQSFDRDADGLGDHDQEDERDFSFHNARRVDDDDEDEGDEEEDDS